LHLRPPSWAVFYWEKDMQETLDIDDVKNLFCAFKGAINAGLSPEGVQLGDEILQGFAENERLSPAVRWILSTAASMSDVPALPQRPSLQLIQGGRSGVGWNPAA
jgi:hypothetical protein